MKKTKSIEMEAAVATAVECEQDAVSALQFTRIADATHAQDVLELSTVTMPQQGAPIVDISWEKSPLDL